MTDAPRSPRLPPRWFIRTFWVLHRILYALSGGRLGLREPRSDVWGMLRLQTTGRRSGRRHDVIVAYIADGPDLLLVAMNGWAEPMPAWWLNLKAHPDTVVELPGGAVREVTAREAAGSERDRLWSLWRPVWKDFDAWATRRTKTPLIVLEPRRGRPA